MTLGIYWATGVPDGRYGRLAGRFVASPRPHLRILIVTTALVVGFGALTLFFNDARFIKMKPTIVNLMFAAFLFGGLLLRRPVLQHILWAKPYG